MRKITILILLLGFTMNVKSQESYFVTFVKGTVILDKTQQLLKVGDEIKETNKLKFTQATDAVGAVSEKGRRVKLSLTQSQIERQKTKSEFVSVLSAFLPVRKVAALRALTKRVVLHDEFEMEYFFGAKNHDLAGFMWNKKEGEAEDEGKTFLILGQGEYPVRAKEFLQNDAQYFYLTYTVAGQTHKKILPYQGKNLWIDSTIFKTDKQQFAPEAVKDIKMFYRFADGHSQFITEFRPVFGNDTELKNSLHLLIEKAKLTQTDTEVIFRNEILPFLSDFYGEPEPYNVKVWLEKHLNFKVAIGE
jgi:hypothetical protein